MCTQKYYKPVTVPIESNSTYKLSYVKHNIIPRKKSQVSKKLETYGKLDLNTVNKITYQWPKTVERVQRFYPKSCLKREATPIEFITIYMNSFSNPEKIERVSCTKAKLIERRHSVAVPMENTTIMKESYILYKQKSMPDKDKKFPTQKHDIKKWRSNFRPDYQTIYGESYKQFTAEPVEIHRPYYKPSKVTSKISTNTIYTVSYGPNDLQIEE